MRNIDFFQENRLPVIPMDSGSTNTPINDWASRKYQDNNPDEFSNDSNFGVVLGDASGIVDIYFPTWYALELAHYLFPPTGWKFGRESRPYSDWVYQVTGNCGETESYSAEGEEVGLEIRANGSATLFPPSLDGATGEPLKFSVQGRPGLAIIDYLHSAAKLMCECAVCIPDYPDFDKGEFLLVTCREFLEEGHHPILVSKFVHAICDVTKDPQQATWESMLSKELGVEPIAQSSAGTLDGGLTSNGSRKLH